MEKHPGLAYCPTNCTAHGNDNRQDVRDMPTSKLVMEYADLRVWFAQKEITVRVPAGKRKHERLCAVVDQLRWRGVLD